MKVFNWKTSLAGAVAVIPQIVVLIWPEAPTPIMNFITSFAAFIAFLFAKDKDVTGGTKTQS